MDNPQVSPETQARVVRLLADVCARTGTSAARYDGVDLEFGASYNVWTTELRVSESFALQITDEELADVLAQEMGHAHRRWKIRAYESATALLLIGAFVSSVGYLLSVWTTFRWPSAGHTALCLFFLLSLVPTVRMREEFFADDFAVRYAGSVSRYIETYIAINHVLGNGLPLNRRLIRLRQRAV